MQTNLLVLSEAITMLSMMLELFYLYLIVSLHPCLSSLAFLTGTLNLFTSLFSLDWLSSIGASALPGALSLSHCYSAWVQQPSKYTQQGSHSQLDGHHSQHQPVSLISNNSKQQNGPPYCQFISNIVQTILEWLFFVVSASSVSLQNVDW